MIELNFGKLLLLAVIALIVLGPEKLPKAARMAGAMLRRLRLGWESVRSEVERELQLEEIRRAAKETAEHADALRKSASDEVHSAHAAMNATVAEVAQTTQSVASDVAGRESRHGDA